MIVYTFYKNGTEETGNEETFTEENTVAVECPMGNNKVYELQPLEKKFFKFEGKMNLDIVAGKTDTYYIDRLVAIRYDNIGFTNSLINVNPFNRDESDIYMFKGTNLFFCDNQVNTNGYVVHNRSNHKIYVIPKKGYRE